VRVPLEKIGTREGFVKCNDWAQVVEQVVRRCQAMGASRADAEDCVHEAVVCWLRRQADPDAEPVTAVAAWLTVTARRKLIDRLRRSARERQAVIRLGNHGPCDAEPGETVSERALAAFLVQSLQQLPTSTRRVCEAVASGADVDQVAQQLGLSRRAVQSHLTRARRLLRHLAAGAVAALACVAARLLRSTGTVAAPVAAATISTTVVLLPHHTPLPPPVTLHAIVSASPTLTAPGQAPVPETADALPATEPRQRPSQLHPASPDQTSTTGQSQTRPPETANIPGPQTPNTNSPPAVPVPDSR
jgi:RNA polymerase sigma factor (sigma-70 family)